MHEHNNNTLDISGIEKYDGTFEQEESGCTIVVNQTVNSIKNLAAGGLYLYLICRPKNWKLNVKHLATLFDCNKDKIYKLIDYLMEIKLLTRQELRDKGKIVNYHYRIHLRPTTLTNTASSPRLEKPDTEKPDTENPDTYKTKNVLNKEKQLDIYIAQEPEIISTPKNTNYVRDTTYQETLYQSDHDLKTHIAEQGYSDETFNIFWDIYPIHKGKDKARLAWFTSKCYKTYELILTKLQQQIEKDCVFLDGFAPNPVNYIWDKRWEDEIQVRKNKKEANKNFHDTDWAVFTEKDML